MCGCYIDNVCYYDGQPHPDSRLSQCNVCNRKLNLTGWTALPDQQCNDNDMCTHTDTCRLQPFNDGTLTPGDAQTQRWVHRADGTPRDQAPDLVWVGFTGGTGTSARATRSRAPFLCARTSPAGEMRVPGYRPASAHCRFVASRLWCFSVAHVDCLCGGLSCQTYYSLAQNYTCREEDNSKCIRWAACDGVGACPTTK